MIKSISRAQSPSYSYGEILILSYPLYAHKPSICSLPILLEILTEYPVVLISLNVDRKTLNAIHGKAYKTQRLKHETQN
jgi:hypothetical protein